MATLNEIASNISEEIGSFIAIGREQEVAQIIARHLEPVFRERGEMKLKLAIVEPLQKRWGAALSEIHNRFGELNGRECSRECGQCIKCIAAKALIPGNSENEPEHIP